MQHSYSNDDTCFRMDVIEEVSKEELDALLNDSEPFLNTSEKINETSLDKEFKEFMAVYVEEISEQEEEVEDNFKELTHTGNLRIKTSIQDPPTDLEMKPLPKHLKYAFSEKDSLLPVVISTMLKDDPFSKSTRKHFLGKHPTFQEKTTFTYPYGTYAYKRIPFGSLNAPATFDHMRFGVPQAITSKDDKHLREGVFADFYSGLKITQSFSLITEHLEIKNHIEKQLVRS
ncbi:hypothetical protein Tco_1245515 [Tanacetum coccineum]